MDEGRGVEGIGGDIMTWFVLPGSPWSGGGVFAWEWEMAHEGRYSSFKQSIIQHLMSTYYAPNSALGIRRSPWAAICLARETYNKQIDKVKIVVQPAKW
jgi:hypothetical protein